MRKHAELEVEEVLSLAPSVLFWFVNLVPNVGNVLVNLGLYFLRVVASVVEVSQHEEQPLGGGLTEQL